ncbi:MAG: hypothetical protein SOY76_02400 [Veillonella caviae]|nr:hypothetical protein [Veillonella caviae]
MIKIRLDLEYPSLNEYIQAERSNRFKGAKLKKTYTDATQMMVARYRGAVKSKADIHFEWHTSRKVDPDNLDFARKFILDGFVKAGVLIDDNQKYIGRLSSEIVKDKKGYVIVVIKEEE